MACDNEMVPNEQEGIEVVKRELRGQEGVVAMGGGGR